MAFCCVACIIASRLDLACLVSARRGLRGFILCCLVWLFLYSVLFALAAAIFCCASPLCLVVCFWAPSCFVVSCSLGLGHAWGSVFICVCRLKWRVLPLISSGLPCRFAMGIGSFCPRYLFETLLYESPRRKPGWRFTAGVKYCARSDLKQLGWATIDELDHVFWIFDDYSELKLKIAIAGDLDFILKLDSD